MALDLFPLCDIDLTLSDPVFVGEAAAGVRLIYEVAGGVVSGERLHGTMRAGSSADWVTVVGTVGTVDVRVTIETDDGAVILVQYRGRTDLAGARAGAAPIYVAPTFETGDERYAWLNVVQAVGVGTLDGNALHYEWFEVR